MSDDKAGIATPRTDAASFKATKWGADMFCVQSDFARQLERELAVAMECIGDGWARVQAARDAQSAELHRVVAEVAAERQRQREKEGWDDEHDDYHDTGGLALAAACYASLAAVQASERTPQAIYANAEPPFRWPWERKWWKPKNPRRDLIRAAALIVAEIERLDRKAPSARSATAPIRGMPIIKALKDQRDGAADVLRRLMHKLREDSGSTDPMEPFAYDHSWELLAIEADAILAKCPSWTQQLRNIAEGLGMTYEELVAGIDRATNNATDRRADHG